MVLLGETVALGAVRRAAGPASREATRRRSMIAYGPSLHVLRLNLMSPFGVLRKSRWRGQVTRWQTTMRESEPRCGGRGA